MFGNIGFESSAIKTLYSNQRKREKKNQSFKFSAIKKSIMSVIPKFNRISSLKTTY